nr:MAG TPA: hypothetical protein [Caudoviricetes sp.]
MVISTSKYNINTGEIPNKYLVFVIFNYNKNSLFIVLLQVLLKYHIKNSLK